MNDLIMPAPFTPHGASASNSNVNGNANANANAYLTTKVMTANPAELRLLLLEGAVRFAEQARAAIDRRDHEAAYTGATRCQAILMELLNGLRPEHDKDLCDRLSALYTYMYTTMVKATSERTSAPIVEVIKLLEFERDTWRMLIEQLAAENRSAGALADTPDARPLTGGGATNAEGLVGANVSLRG